MRYLLAGVVVVMAAGTEPICVGMTWGEVSRVLGRDSLYLSWAGTHWRRVDCLGGEEEWLIAFEREPPDTQFRVRFCEGTYHPFAARPPWVDVIHAAFSPRPSP